MSSDAAKRAAAAAAVALVEDGTAIGIGTGSTAAHFIELLGERVRDGLSVRGVPTSEATARMAQDLGIALTTLEADPVLALTVDGVDEIDPEMRAIKGGGGALLREKIVASASRRVVYIADDSKGVDRLGAFALPVEVIPMALPVVLRQIAELGCEPVLRMDGESPFVSDEGNRIVDCPFGVIEGPEELAAALSNMPGVVEHGLFIGLIDEMILGSADGSTRTL